MQLDYHQTSVSRMSEFVSRYEHPTTAINVLMDPAAKQLIDRNKTVIESLLKITMRCGKQGLPVRGMMVLILGKEVNLQTRAISLNLSIFELKVMQF